MKYKLVLDVGTTSIRVVLFNLENQIIDRQSQKLVKNIFPGGLVEQDALEILRICEDLLKQVVVKNSLNQNDILGFGLTNQRETVVVWDKNSGQPINPAIVWEDERTNGWCQQNKIKFDSLVRQLTGLPLNPYFSATKLSWILKNVVEKDSNIDLQNLLFGNIDSWLIWNFTKGKNHLTDYTNASRTLLFNINTFSWDEKLLSIFSIPSHILPKAIFSKGDFGRLDKYLLGFEIPIVAVCGDQQSSCYAVGFERGTTKITYGTGTFIMQITEDRIDTPPFFTTLAVGENGPVFALEAKVGRHGNQIDDLLKNHQSLDPLVLEICKQASDYIHKLPILPPLITVDGGITQAENLLKFQTETSGVKIVKQSVFEGTALGISKMIC